MLKFNKITTIVSSLLATVFIVLSTVFITKYALLEKNLANEVHNLYLEVDVDFGDAKNSQDILMEKQVYKVITNDLNLNNSLYDGMESSAFKSKNKDAHFVWSGPSSFGYMLTSINGVGPIDLSDHHYWQLKSSTSKDVDANGITLLGASGLLLDYVNVFEFDYVSW